MLNKVLVAKFLTAMTLAGLATGAAAGFDGEVAGDDDTIELETPFDDDESTSSDESDDADDSDDDADDAAAEEEADEDADDSDDAAVKEAKDPNHGSIVSECARTTEATGRAHGQAVSTVAQDDTADCAAPAEEAGDDEAPAADDEADDADVADDEAEDKPRAAKAQGADHRHEKATEKLAERDARKAGR